MSGLTTYDVIRAAIPDADETLCSFILWERTAYPFSSSPQGIYRAASRWKRAETNGIRLCDHCKRRARPDAWTCERCEAALQRAREAV